MFYIYKTSDIDVPIASGSNKNTVVKEALSKYPNTSLIGEEVRGNKTLGFYVSKCTSFSK